MTDFERALIDALNRLAAAVENFKPVAATAGKTRSKSSTATRKEGELTVSGIVDSVSAPNQWGWVSAKIDGLKIETKSKTFAASFEQAMQQRRQVLVTYNAVQNGKYTNNYAQTVMIQEGEPVKVSNEGPEDDEMPF